MMCFRYRFPGLLLLATLSWLNIATACGGAEPPRRWTTTQEHRGFVVFQHPTGHSLGPSDIPHPEECLSGSSKTDVPDKVTCSLPRGEYESVHVGIHALAADIRQVHLSAKSAVPVGRRILPQGPRDSRVTELLKSFVRKEVE
ncbi:MAG: hypothetical protein VX346_14560 [Planctomycetota bacterium]|nr:hypothetical protein [Planctomycetota bacterium]